MSKSPARRKRTRDKASFLTMKPPSERFLEGVFRLGRYRAWWVLLVWMVITGFAVYYALEIPFRGSFLDLLPRDDPLINEYRENEQYFGDAVGLLIELVGEIPDDVYARDARLLAAARTLAELLREEEEITEVVYLQEISASIPDQYIQLFNLDADQLTRIEESLELARTAIGGGDFGLLGGDLLSSELAAARNLDQLYAVISDQFNRALMSGQASLGAYELGDVPIRIQLDQIFSLNEGVLRTLGSLDTLPAVTEAVDDLSGIFMPEVSDALREPQPYISADHTMLLMVAQPRFPSQRGLEYSTLITDLVDAAIRDSEVEALGVRVRQTGTYPFNKATTAAVNRDMLRTTVISSVGVFVIFLVAFGSFFYSVIAVIPLLVSVVITMAWARFAVDGFNLVTTFLPALVLGLGIDYAIHLIARYAEERSQGRSLNRALLVSILSKGRASLYAAATTALVFVVLLTSKSRALYEMGMITSIGVVSAFLATLFLIPTLITLSHFLFRIRRKEGVVSMAPRMSGVFRLITGRARVIFVLVLVLTLFVAFQAAQTTFEFSSTDLMPRVESQEIAEIIQENFASSPSGVGSVFTFYASTGEELRTVVDKLADVQLQRTEFGLPPLVESVESPLDFLPVNLAEQQEMLGALDMESSIDQLDVLSGSLAAQTSVSAQLRTVLAQFSLLQYASSAQGEIGLGMQASQIIRQLREIQGLIDGTDTDAVQVDVERLRAALGALRENLDEVRDLPPAEELIREVLLAYPEALRATSLTADGRFVIQARVSRHIFDEENMTRFRQFASSFSNDYFGMPMVVQQLEGYMKRDFYLSTGIAVLLILGIVWGSLRGWMRALLAVSPLVLGYVWMLGGMRLLSMNFNFLSITISPLLIGIGVDNGIHILHRTIEEAGMRREDYVERGVGTTAIAVVVTSLTTMLVFGSLLVARTPGLRMLGASALLGIGFALLFSLLFLPAALKVEGGKRV
jgi:uncharacterized protein